MVILYKSQLSNAFFQPAKKQEIIKFGGSIQRQKSAIALGSMYTTGKAFKNFGKNDYNLGDGIDKKTNEVFDELLKLMEKKPSNIIRSKNDIMNSRLDYSSNLQF